MNRFAYVISRSLFVSALLLLAACSSKEVDPEELPAELVDFKPVIKVKRIWDRSVGEGSESLRLALRPGTDGARVYAAAHDGNISAFELTKGKRIWRSETELPLSAGPTSDGKIVAAGSSNGEVIVLDAQTGEPRWTVSVTSEVLASPAISTTAVIVQTVNGKLTALDRDTGATLWSVQQSMPRLSVRGTSSPVVSRNRVISGFDNGHVAAFEIEDGAVTWDVLMQPPSGRTELERLVDINASVQVAGSDVYAVGYQGRLGAIAVDSGQLIWSREMSSHAGLSVDAGNIYISNQQSELVAVSRASGREIWRRKDLRNRDITGTAIVGSSVVVGDFEGFLHWFDLETGELQARVRAGSERVATQPLIVGDTLLAMTDGGTLAAFQIRTEN